MTSSFFGSKDLRARLLVLRRIFPLGILLFVLIYQAFSVLVLSNISPVVHYSVDVVAYGIIGPLAAWFTINWLAQQVQVREKALADKTRAEQEQHRAEQAARTFRKQAPPVLRKGYQQTEAAVARTREFGAGIAEQASPLIERAREVGAGIGESAQGLVDRAKSFRSAS